MDRKIFQHIPHISRTGRALTLTRRWRVVVEPRSQTTRALFRLLFPSGQQRGYKRNPTADPGERTRSLDNICRWPDFCTYQTPPPSLRACPASDSMVPTPEEAVRSNKICPPPPYYLTVRRLLQNISDEKRSAHVDSESLEWLTNSP